MAILFILTLLFHTNFFVYDEFIQFAIGLHEMTEREHNILVGNNHKMNLNSQRPDFLISSLHLFCEDKVPWF